MQVSVSKVGNIGRKLNVEVPESQILEQQEKRVLKIAKGVKMDGFRKGKVPLNIVKERYAEEVNREVMGDVIQTSLIEALTQEKLNPAGMPQITETKFEAGKPFTYVAEFEVYPEITLKDFSDISVEKCNAEVTDADVTKTLESIRGQYKDWQAVERACKEGDQADLNFNGSIDGEEFEGGKAENFKLELGAGKMIPGFETGIIGMQAGEEKVIQVTFPDEYAEASLAGKVADFAIKINAVEESALPELNDELAKKLGVEGGLTDLTAEVRKNMERELENKLHSDLKRKAMDELYAKNELEVPKSLVDREVEHMVKQMMQQYGQQVSEEAIKGVLEHSRATFEVEARKRCGLGLLTSEIIQQHKIATDDALIRARVESIAQAYEKPQEVITMYYNDKERLATIEGLVIEDMVVDKILEAATVTEKTIAFDDIMQPEKDA